MVKNIAVIPARSGSTRIKDKNIYPFKGKPLVTWTIEAALKSKKFDRVIVSTDSENYAQIARQYGAEVPFLRDKYADNSSSCAMVALYAAKQAEEYWGEVYENITILQATCPLRDENDINNAVNFFNENNIKAVITATPYTANPWWGATLDEFNRPAFVLFSPEKCPSQSKPPMFCPNGAITVVDKDYLIKNQSVYTDELRFLRMDWTHSIDIDNIEDIKLAEIIFDYIKGSRCISSV